MFRKYTGKDVSEEYVFVDLPRIGKAWAKAEKHTPVEVEYLGEGYSVEVLGWGSQPYFDWNEVPEKTKRILLENLSKKG